MATGRILLVDGDYDACDALVESLRERGYQVDFAYNAQDALELAGRHYELAILDHWPPYLDAFGLHRRLRMTAPGTITVVIGDGALHESPDAARHPGVARLLSRSADRESLFEIVDELLGVHEIAAA
jgi:DNA-binding NtrC family response regulator